VAAEKALALVVRGTDWSETSRITTLFTREFGKVRALAKGGRRLKSSFDSAFDLLSLCQIVFIRKAHGGLDLLTEAQLAERFPALRRDLSSLYAGYYIAELLADGAQDYDPHPPLFDAALATLRGLEGVSPPLGKATQGSGCSPAVLDAVTAFELVWLRELGYSPRLDVCTGCGAEVLPVSVGRVFFSPAASGVLCPGCGPTAPDRRSMTVAGLIALRGLTDQDETTSELTPVRRELRAVLGSIVSTVLGRRPRLLGYVDGR